MGFNKNERKDAEKFLKESGYRWDSDRTKLFNDNGKSVKFSDTGKSMNWNGSSYNDSAGYKNSKNNK